MKRLTRSLPLLLAATLQLLPLLRNIVTSPTASSSFAIILRWGIGSAIGVGAYDAYSAASSGVPLTTTNHLYLTAGIATSNVFNFVITGGNSATAASDYFIISTTNGVVTSSALFNGQSTTVCMPSGLTFKSVIKDNATNIYGIISGTPSSSLANFTTNLTVTPTYNGGGSPPQILAFPTNVAITILPAPSGVAPIITNNPVSVTTNVGNNVTFSVTNGGTAPFTYQWYFNTNTALPNATNASVTLTNVQLTNSGYYRVAITNSTGSTNSLNALLTVIQPPVITNSPPGFTTNVGGSVTFTPVVGGSAPLAYQWYFNTNTALPNATNATLTLATLQTSNTGSYTFIVTNAGGSATSAPALLTVWQPPVITNHPAGTTNLAGCNHTLTVLAGGSAQLKYQWYFNTATALPNATNTALALTGIRASQAGIYMVVITNAGGAVTSSVALLSVTNPLPSAFTPTAPVKSGSQFQFTFTPVIGLTNTVWTNGVLAGGTWNVFTNIPPPATATPITIIDLPGSPNRFYRVSVVP